MRPDGSSEPAWARSWRRQKRLAASLDTEAAVPGWAFFTPTLWDYWQFYVGRLRGGAVDALRGFDEICGFGLVNAGDEFLRVAVDHGKPRGLNLDHHAVTFQEDVVVVAQRDFPFCGLVGGERVRFFVILEIAAAAHFHGDGEFVAV